MPRSLLVGLLTFLSACAEPSLDARALEIVQVISKTDEPLIRAREALVHGKYTRMSKDPVAFVRGTLALYRHDVRDGTTDAGASDFALDTMVPSLGDAHVENFGTLQASDGTWALEPNDFDAADHAPYLWDVRRLSASLALAAEISNPTDEPARRLASVSRRSIARAAAESYALALGAAPERVDERSKSVILADLFSRSKRDGLARRELSELTIVNGASRSLRRGTISPDHPEEQLAPLPEAGRAALPAALERYRSTLIAPPDAAFFRVLDAARQFGSGIASWPRVRVLVLVRGPSDAPEDDVILEMKELADSSLAGQLAPGIYHRDVASRVLSSARGHWARPDADPLWGTSEWLGFPVQIRTETEAHKGLRISRLQQDRGTPEALLALAEILGRLLARIHASEALAIRHRIADRVAAFADEQAEFADGYVALQLADSTRFAHALEHLGPRLGIPFDPSDHASADANALFGLPEDSRP
jgi:uncharacterized protein (DUF2252 family)